MRLTVFAFIAGFCITAIAQEAKLPPPTTHYVPYEWHGPGGCIVNLWVKTPCRTIRFHEYSFRHGLGVTGVTKSETIAALDESGSESKRVKSSRRRWLILKHRLDRTELVLRGKEEDQILVLDHLTKTFETRAGQRNVVYWENDDSQCTGTASKARYLTSRLPDTRIANVDAVGWRGRDARGWEYEVYFAPSIGCQELRFKEVERDSAGRISSEFMMEVDSYLLGPPDPGLFSVPSNYRQVHSVVAGR